ncbi:MAG: zinc transporter ZupT [Asgard group archaeon]|nr:zinc transporter ZupT [Asgard group archaeon]
MNIVLIAFLLASFAGLSTGIGSAIPFFFKRFKKSYLAFFLGLSAGVMILVSFMELLKNALKSLESYWVYLAFFGGMAVVVILDFAIPHGKNPHHMNKSDAVIKEIQAECQGEVCEDIPELRVSDEGGEEKSVEKSLARTGIITAIAIAIHNFPEGFATFTSALEDINVGISISIAIAIHNIPEGISVSIPIYYATKSKWRSFGLSFASGIAEPVGAILAFGVLRILTQGPLVTNNIIQINPAFIAVSLAVVAGIMIYISIDELIPVAHEYGKGDLVMAGVVLGMLIMAGSLVMFEFM